jgi:S1-C subfamily serine protease
MEDFTINGVVPFLKLLEKWDHDGQALFPLLDKAKDSSDPATISEALNFLELNKLDRFYAKTARALTDKLPGGSREVTEQEAEFWLGKFRMGMANPDNLKKDMEEFDRWKSRHSFAKHPDVGAALNAFAALILVNAGDKEGAKKMCEAASAFKTKDPRIRDLLAALNRALTGKTGNMEPLPRGSGSGFCIAAGNYIMTNHHVIRDAKKIMIHLNDDEERFPAHLVADNPEGDMAVLKADLPADKALTPIPFAATDVSTGEEVCALGWPGLLSDNPASVLTKGIVSTKHKDDGYLVVDCKIEHGNSGGPLCSVSGCCIAGMVSAKTATTGELSESYGLAIPASQLKKFLKDKLPREILSKIPRQTSATGGRLAETVKRITPSVVYVENLQ